VKSKKLCEIQETRKAGYGIKSEIYGRDSHSLFGNDHHPLEVGGRGFQDIKP
jgi:hypothetical protein